jgi:hypothetical protein
MSRIANVRRRPTQAFASTGKEPHRCGPFVVELTGINLARRVRTPSVSARKDADAEDYAKPVRIRDRAL